MRLYEILILAGNGLLAVLMLLRVRRAWPLAAGALTLLATLLHVLLEGTRWQMIPLYGLTALLIGLTLYRARQNPAPRRRWRWVWIVAAAACGILPALMPVPKLPQPTGPYDVGTTTFYWVNPDAVDPYTGEVRRLMVQAWYPTDKPSTAEPAPYFPDLKVMAPAIARNFGLPDFMLNHLELSQTHTTLEPPFASDLTQTPVLIFSHGWTGMRYQNTFQVEELVSHGYVVIAADHPEGAVITIYPDGDVIFANQAALPRSAPAAEFNAAARIVGQMWVSDLRFMRAQMDDLQSGAIASPLAGHLDLARVGAFGHSTGGGAVAEFCYNNEDCQAVLTMDAWMVPYDRVVPAHGLTQPALFLRSEKWSLPGNPPLAEALYENSHSPAYLVEIADTRHFDFTDISQLTPLLTLMKLKGTLDSDRAMTIINTYTLAFFDEALRGDASGVPALEELYPEAPLEINTGAP
ncbi:MAG TPA: hypothetical protein PK454_01905 [Anaerolineaceae bacterium]|nr:hypothetical protein [Anaerolineaceae bacterium]